jgi:hypothetical protein
MLVILGKLRISILIRRRQVLDPMRDVPTPFGVILETSMTPKVFDTASGGGGHFWLKEHGVFTTTTLLASKLETDLGFKIFGYSWMLYEDEEAMAFTGHVVSGSKDLVDLPVYGLLVRPVVPGKTILGFVYRSRS